MKSEFRIRPMRWPAASDSPGVSGARPSTVHALVSPASSPYFLRSQPANFVLQLGAERRRNAAPEERVLVEDLDHRQRGIVAITLLVIRIEMREDARPFAGA